MPWSDSPIIGINNAKAAFGSGVAAAAILANTPFGPGTAAALAAAAPGGVVAADDSLRNGNYSTRNTPVSERQEDRNGQIDITWDFAENISFFNSMSYQRYDIGSVNDVDFTGLDFFNFPFAAQQVELFTEEFRFSGQMNDLPLVQSVNWLFGGYYSSENLGTQVQLTFGSDADFVGPFVVGDAAIDGFGIAPGDSQYEVFTQNGKTRALYGHLDIDLLDWLNLSGGARFTTEDKEGGARFNTVNYGGVNPFITAGARPFDAEADADEWIGTVALTVNFTDEISAYTSFAHGYKSGGLNFDQFGGQAGFFGGTATSAALAAAAVSAGAPASVGAAISANGTVADPTFPEELNNTYEVGIKSRFWDNRATLNVTGFHSVFKNYQVLSFTGSSFTILSAPEATTTGLEGELQLAPIDGLNLAAAFTYADAEYSAPFQLDATTALGDSRLTNAPLYSGSVRATYRHPIPNTGLVGLLHGEWSYNSRTNTSTALPSTREQNGFSLFNARLGVNTDDDRYGLQLWCRNCGDEQYRSIIFAGLVGGEFAFISPPREWGVTLSAKY